MNSCEPISITETPHRLKVGNDMVGHCIHLGSNGGGRNQQDVGTVEMPRTILRVKLIPRAPTLAGKVDSLSPDHSFAHANSTQSCRPREALLSSGLLCRKSGTPLSKEAKHRFSDETVADRFGFGRFGAVRGRVRAAVAACAQRRRHSGGQDDPAALADLQLRSLLRTIRPSSPRISRRRLPQATRSCKQLCRVARKRIFAGRRIVATGLMMPSPNKTRRRILQRALPRPRHRKRRRCRKPVGYRRRRSLRVRRYQDVVREGKHLAMGEDTDHLVLGSPPRVSR